MLTYIFVVGMFLLIPVLFLFTALLFRRVVPTNMVHIVQSANSTISYGRGKEDGNTYYAWPSWIPKIGISVIEFPESIFKVTLDDYKAYDQARLPFMVDIVAFFRVSNSGTAAQRVANFSELDNQLHSVLQGAVRRILATNSLEHIMESRSELSELFTKEVKDQIEEWGVIPAKSIEFMDIRDERGSLVIQNIMDKEKSRIDRESRIVVAENHKQAEMAEIDARRTVDVQTQDALQLVGIRTAEKDRVVGIANENATQSVKEQAKITAEKEMAVRQVEEERRAEINKSVAITQASALRDTQVLTAEGEKQSTVLKAEADLFTTLKQAEGVRAIGESEAKSQELLLMAPVNAQVTLAKEIGDNTNYQQYLITVEQITANKDVGIEMAKAIANADIKIIGGDGNISDNVTKVTDMFGASGGMKLGAMMEAFAATPMGEKVVDHLSK